MCLINSKFELNAFSWVKLFNSIILINDTYWIEAIATYEMIKNNSIWIWFDSMSSIVSIYKNATNLL